MRVETDSAKYFLWRSRVCLDPVRTCVYVVHCHGFHHKQHPPLRAGFSETSHSVAGTLWRRGFVTRAGKALRLMRREEGHALTLASKHAAKLENKSLHNFLCWAEPYR